MADRYATNAFTNFTSFENGVFGQGQEQAVLTGDNPDFLYPGKNLRNTVTGKSVKIQRGYMRMLSQGFDGGTPLSKKRLHFQFNPDAIVRSVQARNDIQLWMNQDPLQLTQPIPGDANFAFELLFNREAEVATASYREGSGVRSSQAKASLPLQNAGDNNSQSVNIPHSAVTDIGVLSDLIVFDEIIGQGINTGLIEQVIKNAAGVNAKQRADAASKATTSNTPTSTASAKVVLKSDKTIKEVQIVGGGSGYTSSPTLTLSGGGGSGGTLSAEIANGKVSKITVVSAGSGYTSVPGVTFDGGGGAGSTSSDSTSDSQDQPSVFSEDEARKALWNNFGNSAFLVSLPVRIVFSSLFMVEGYITSTQVTFNKFNPSMVPTQCVVGVTMQALYIGFARKDTYLTKTLEEGLKASKEALAADGTTPNAEQTALTSLTIRMFESKLLSNYGDDNVGPHQIYGRSDTKQTVSVSIKGTKDLKAQLKKNSIKEISQEGIWKITYIGNTSTPTGTVDAGTVLTEMSANSSFNLGDLKGNWDTLKLTFETSALGADQNLDTSSTSQYKIDFTVRFKVTGSNGSTVDSSQYIALSKVVSFNSTLSLASNGSILNQAEPAKTTRLPSGKAVK